MKVLYTKVKVLFKSGMDRMVTFYKEKKKSVFLIIGRFVLYVSKTIIEWYLNTH